MLDDLLRLLQAWMYLLLLAYNYWLQLRHQPFTHTWMNFINSAIVTWLALAAVLNVAGSYKPHLYHALTVVFFAVGPFLALGSMGLTAVRYAAVSH
jgi:hypothetical protein